MALATSCLPSQTRAGNREVGWEQKEGGTQFCVIGFYYLGNSKELRIKIERSGHLPAVFVKELKKQFPSPGKMPQLEGPEQAKTPAFPPFFSSLEFSCLVLFSGRLTLSAAQLVNPKGRVGPVSV